MVAWLALACRSPTMHSTMCCLGAILKPYLAIVGPTLRPSSSSGPILGCMVGRMFGQLTLLLYSAYTFFIGLAARVRSVGMRQPCVEVYFVVAPETHATFLRPIK